MLRGDAEDPLEGARKIVGIAESEFLRGLFDGALAVLEQLHRAVHFEVLQVLKGGLPTKTFKEAA